MGISYSWVEAFNSLFQSEKRFKILILGLDGAGKTTIMYKKKNDTLEEIKTVPTIGFNMENLNFKSITNKNVILQSWDLGGQEGIRWLWKNYYADTDGLIYVIDASDKNNERIETAKNALHSVLEHEDMNKNVILAVFLNKYDKEDCYSKAWLINKLELNKIKNKCYKYRVFETVGMTNVGVYDAFDWLTEQLLNR